MRSSSWSAADGCRPAAATPSMRPLAANRGRDMHSSPRRAARAMQASRGRLSSSCRAADECSPAYVTHAQDLADASQDTACDVLYVVGGLYGNVAALDALEANPNHLPTLEGLGPILVEQKDWEGARECYRKLLQLTGGQGDPVRLGRSYGTLGEIELALGNREKARKRIAKALEYLPDDVGILQSMANLVFEGNEWHHVLGFYNKIIVKGGEPEQVIQAEGPVDPIKVLFFDGQACHQHVDDVVRHLTWHLEPHNLSANPSFT